MCRHMTCTDDDTLQTYDTYRHMTCPWYLHCTTCALTAKIRATDTWLESAGLFASGLFATGHLFTLCQRNRYIMCLSAPVSLTHKNNLTDLMQQAGLKVRRRWSTYRAIQVNCSRLQLGGKGGVRILEDHGRSCKGSCHGTCQVRSAIGCGDIVARPGHCVLGKALVDAPVL